jgi:hypothetical protein
MTRKLLHHVYIWAAWWRKCCTRREKGERSVLLAEGQLLLPVARIGDGGDVVACEVEHVSASVLGRGQDGGGTYKVVVHEEGQHESDQDAQPALSVQVLDHLLRGVGDGV